MRTEPYILNLLWQISWQTAILAALVFSLLALMKKAPASFRYGLCMLALLKFLVPPIAYFPAELAFWQSDPKPAATATIPLSPGLNATIYDSNPLSAADVSAPHAASNEKRDVANAPASSPLPSAATLFRLWLIGVAIMLCILAIRCFAQESLIRKSTPAGAQLEAAIASAAKRLGIKKIPHIRLSNDICTPALMGMLKPCIFLPVRILNTCKAKEVEAILLHELAHLRRNDIAAIWLQQIVLALFYFHPAVWLLARKARLERELACDELVLSVSNISPKDYADGYISVLKLANRQSKLAASVAMAEPFDVEKRRIKMILCSGKTKSSRKWAGIMALVAAIGLPTFTGIAYSASDAPSTDSIRAAWDKQNSAVVSVSYLNDVSRMMPASSGAGSTSGGAAMMASDAPRKTVLEGTYIRTPEMLYKKGRNTRSSIRIGVARVGEGRSLETSSKGVSIGRLSPESKSFWTQTDRMETILYPMYSRNDDIETMFLYGWLKYAKVSDKMEKINGHACWKLDITDTGDSIVKHYQIWVDPEIGYCQRRISMDGMGCHKRGEMSPFKIVIDSDDYREISKGVWFPGKQTYVNNWPAAGMKNATSVYTLAGVVRDKQYANDSLTIKWPAGSKVYVDIPGKYERKTCVAKADGSLEETAQE